LKTNKSTTMKKLILLSMILVLTISSFAQMKKDRTTAFNYWQKATNNDDAKQLIKAKEFIDKAVAYPEAEADAKVWFYKGAIYLDIFRNPVMNPMFPNCLEPSCEALQKAGKLDAKEEYKADIAIRMKMIAGEMFNLGKNYLFVDKNYAEALNLFDKAINLTKEAGEIDTLSMYGKALTYYSKNDSINAEQAYQQLVELKYNDPEIYSSLAYILVQNKKNDNAEKVISQGIELYPDSVNLQIAKANILMQSKKYAEAVQCLSTLKSKFPGNTSILYSIGIAYDQMKNDAAIPETSKEEYLTKAAEIYTEVLNIDPDFFDANFNMGAMYYNKGGDIINTANQLPINEQVKFDKLMAEGNANLQKALPYFEKAESLRPDDKDVLLSLKEIYTRLKMYDKMNSINTKLGK
jgi:tetratricopeptide (TPR) repeat protein